MMDVLTSAGLTENTNKHSSPKEKRKEITKRAVFIQSKKLFDGVSF